jgi:sulfatase modifying factor 1
MSRYSRFLVAIVVLAFAGGVQADIFAPGGPNQFTIDFVPISGDAGDLGSWPAGSGYTFTGVNRDDYRMGTFEITNDQWDKFQAELGVPVTGDPLNAYNEDPYWTGANVPTNYVSWYEAAQFVNWLNTSKGYQAAYKFTGTQGTGDYTLDTWSTEDADNGNLYRHKDAFYYMPTKDEWVKAGYWNGTSLQNLCECITRRSQFRVPGPGEVELQSVCRERALECGQWWSRGTQRHVRHDGQRL